jgi:hypothetical protein
MYLDLLIPILQHLQLVPVIKQVKELSSIDLEERNIKLGLLISILSLGQSIQIPNRRFIGTFHGECLARASLAISKACDYASVEGKVEIRLDGCLIQIII